MNTRVHGKIRFLSYHSIVIFDLLYLFIKGLIFRPMYFTKFRGLLMRWPKWTYYNTVKVSSQGSIYWEDGGSSPPPPQTSHLPQKVFLKKIKRYFKYWSYLTTILRNQWRLLTDVQRCNFSQYYMTTHPALLCRSLIGWSSGRIAPSSPMDSAAKQNWNRMFNKIVSNSRKTSESYKTQEMLSIKLVSGYFSENYRWVSGQF